jgi:hypothetical protein
MDRNFETTAGRHWEDNWNIGIDNTSLNRTPSCSGNKNKSCQTESHQIKELQYLPESTENPQNERKSLQASWQKINIQNIQRAPKLKYQNYT